MIVVNVIALNVSVATVITVKAITVKVIVVKVNAVTLNAATSATEIHSGIGEKICFSSSRASGRFSSVSS
ncbi:hypothetical protein L0F51_13225 [Afifella sp. H1R]|uniref:hypothetical protein n=1 Tax=Afifella sp. H1R TaxID=2908841 RepID=UPI001F2AF30B|nr:hypothetical protein [Afifella sp. H1R]MCF1504711.1 hypothetical protein [Afifella sp. H1R]